MANNENAYTKYAKYTYDDILSVRDELTPAILPRWDDYVKALRTAEDAREKMERLRANPVYDETNTTALSSRYVKELTSSLRELNFRVVDANYVLAKFVLGMDIHKSQIIDQYDKDTGIVKYIWFNQFAMMEVNKA